MNRPAASAADLSALSPLAPEVAAAVATVASDLALVIDAGGTVRHVAEGPSPWPGQATRWLGHPWADSATADTRGKLNALLTEARRDGMARRREVNHPAGDGTLPLTWTALRLGDNGPVLAVGSDLRATAALQQRFVEAQQAMERDHWARQQTESRYRALFHVATDAVLVVDAAALTIVEANPAASALFDLPAQALAGMPVSACVERAYRVLVDQMLADARGPAGQGELQVRLAARLGLVELSATAFHGGRDALLMVRARTLETVGTVETRERWADFVERSPDAVVITDLAGRVQMANPAFAWLCGLQNAAQAHDLIVGELIGDSRNGLARVYEQVRREGAALQHTLALRAPRGGLLAVEVCAALLNDPEHDGVGLTLRPLSERGALPLPAIDALAMMIERVTHEMGQTPLPELVQRIASQAERHLVQLALERSGGHTAEAALLLGLDAARLEERLRVLGLTPQRRN